MIWREKTVVKMGMSKFRKVLKYLPYLHKIIWFNFKYLPFSQAIRLPILLYKPKLRCLKGKVSIEGPIRTGMIQMGCYIVPVCLNRGIMWENRGTVIFKGGCVIGNDSYITVGLYGQLTFGENFTASANLRAICHKQITFGSNVLVGWTNLFCDTDFHSIKIGSPDNYNRSKGYAPIMIGDDNWFAISCIVLKGTVTPPFAIVGAGTVLQKDYSQDAPRCLIAGNPARVVKQNVWHDKHDDSINYDVL